MSYGRRLLRSWWPAIRVRLAIAAVVIVGAVISVPISVAAGTLADWLVEIIHPATADWPLWAAKSADIVVGSLCFISIGCGAFLAVGAAALALYLGPKRVGQIISPPRGPLPGERIGDAPHDTGKQRPGSLPSPLAQVAHVPQSGNVLRELFRSAPARLR
jgi:hypothetical protein